VESAGGVRDGGRLRKIRREEDLPEGCSQYEDERIFGEGLT
jgi:hypothetical protein